MYNLERIEERILDNIYEAGYKFEKKSDSRLMKILSKILFFNKSFNTEFITVLGKKIYIPEKFNEWPIQTRIMVLAHELQHIRDKQKFKSLLSFTYMMPQIFALLSFLAFINLWWLLCLLFLLPLPSPRAIWEWRCYKINLMLFQKLESTYDISPSIDCEVEFLTNIVKYFTNSSYYFMFPFGKFLRKKGAKILCGDFGKLTPCQNFLIQFINSQKI